MYRCMDLDKEDEKVVVVFFYRFGVFAPVGSRYLGLSNGPRECPSHKCSSGDLIVV